MISDRNRFGYMYIASAVKNTYTKLQTKACFSTDRYFSINTWTQRSIKWTELTLVAICIFMSLFPQFLEIICLKEKTHTLYRMQNDEWRQIFMKQSADKLTSVISVYRMQNCMSTNYDEMSVQLYIKVSWNTATNDYPVINNRSTTSHCTDRHQTPRDSNITVGED